jgi:hypothetical protein
VDAAFDVAVNNFGDTRSGGLAGPMGLFIIVLMSIATVLLIRNMNKRLRRLPESFPTAREAEVARLEADLARTESSTSTEARPGEAQTRTGGAQARPDGGQATATEERPAGNVAAESPAGNAEAAGVQSDSKATTETQSGDKGRD